jgi:hypothetical protein
MSGMPRLLRTRATGLGAGAVLRWRVGLVAGAVRARLGFVAGAAAAAVDARPRVAAVADERPRFGFAAAPDFRRAGAVRVAGAAPDR